MRLGKKKNLKHQREAVNGDKSQLRFMPVTADVGFLKLTGVVCPVPSAGDRRGRGPSFRLEPGPIVVARDGFSTGPGRSVLGRVSGCLSLTGRRAWLPGVPCLSGRTRHRQGLLLDPTRGGVRGSEQTRTGTSQPPAAAPVTAQRCPVHPSAPCTVACSHLVFYTLAFQALWELVKV